MIPYHIDPWLTVWQGDCREVMAQMEPESVHCVVTSPPYWGLRDYGTATWLGGDEGCDHKGPPKASDRSGLNHGRGRSTYEDAATVPFVGTCGKCGAVRQDSQLGLEPTPEEYVANMVAVFREVRRVLRADGTVWLNLGDSYAGQAGGPQGQRGDRASRTFTGTMEGGRGGVGLKPKDLVGIPWRVAFALQADGWYLRSDIIWAKPNPMPESVTDRPTKAHEYLVLLSKSARYYYDADAVREPLGEWSQQALASGWTRKVKNTPGGQAPQGFVPERGQGNGYGDSINPAGRNLRSVWNIATQPYPGAHFATFPEALVEPCVKAGTSERGVCPECGAPWERKTVREGGERYATGKSEAKNRVGLATAFSGYTDGSSAPTFRTTGWFPTCDRYGHLIHTGSDGRVAAPVPATVLDPFAGSGTTGRVAQRLGRRAVLIDLNGEYLTQAMKRNADIPLGLEAS